MRPASGSALGTVPLWPCAKLVKLSVRGTNLSLRQVVEDGYEFFARRQLVTIFSAPNYCGEFDNAGAMMSVDETLMCSFQILKPAEKKQARRLDALSLAQPVLRTATASGKGKLRCHGSMAACCQVFKALQHSQLKPTVSLPAEVHVRWAGTTRDATQGIQGASPALSASGSTAYVALRHAVG